MPKPNPSGFVARCPQCHVITGAMDYTRTERKEAAALLGKWLMSGHIVEPRHNDWRVTGGACQCQPEGD